LEGFCKTPFFDISKMAQEAGFNISVAVTDSVWSDLITWSDEDTQKQVSQDAEGRLWDVLSMLRFAIAKERNSSCIIYKLYVIPRDGKSRKTKLTQLKAVIGAGDNGEPVITIMLPNED
jgi:hypothetical protein